MAKKMQPSHITIEDVARKWGSHLSQLIVDNISLEKRVEVLQNEIAELAKNEAALVDHIQYLESEVKELSDRSPLSEKARAILREGNAIIEETKKPPEGGLKSG